MRLVKSIIEFSRRGPGVATGAAALQRCSLATLCVYPLRTMYVCHFVLNITDYQSVVTDAV